MAEIIGINWQTAQPYAFAGKHKWNLKEGGLTEKTLEQILTIADKFESDMKSAKGDLATFRIKNAAAKKLLTLTLEKFQWGKPANDPKVGPGGLFALAGEVKVFLATGGAPVRRGWQTSLNTKRQPSSRTSPN